MHHGNVSISAAVHRRKDRPEWKKQSAAAPVRGVRAWNRDGAATSMHSFVLWVMAPQLAQAPFRYFFDLWAACRVRGQ